MKLFILFYISLVATILFGCGNQEKTPKAEQKANGTKQTAKNESISVQTISQKDFDGDGLTGEEDKYPFLANSPDVSWEIKELIFTWDVDHEKIMESSSARKEGYLTETAFSFGTKSPAG